MATKVVTSLIDDSLTGSALALAIWRSKKKDIEREEKVLSTSLKEQLAKYRDEYPEIMVFATHFSDTDEKATITITPATSRRVNPEKLLSRGVDPEIIADCMEVTSYERITIT